MWACSSSSDWESKKKKGTETREGKDKIMIIYKGRWERKNGVGHKMVESETTVLESDSNKGKEVITGWSREGGGKNKKQKNPSKTLNTFCYLNSV